MTARQESALTTQANSYLTTLVSKLREQAGGVDVRSSIDRFIATFSVLPPYAGYKHIPVAAREQHGAIRECLGAQGSKEFLYACMLRALLNSVASPSFACLPPRIKGQQLRQYQRIIDQATAITEVCELDQDLFHKDFGLALIRLYAAAAQLVDYRAGLSRTLLVKDGLVNLPRRLAIFAKVGGFKPFFEIHTHLSYLDEFNEEGWNECYRCCAELYALHPRALGMYGGSWFYDPDLAQISPRLGYLREIPKSGGAYLLFDSISEQSTRDATSTSPTRSKLYADGIYQPKSYALIWPRDAQIRWAHQHDLPAKSA